MLIQQFRRRVIALTVALLVVAPLSVIAANWQWNRHLERDARNDLISLNAVKLPVAFETLNTATVTSKNEWRPVTLTGHFEQSRQKLWRKQPLNGEPGFIVITPFVADSQHEFLIERGWVAADGKLPANDVDLSVAPTTQTITARARLMTSNADPDPNDLPAGQTNNPRTMLNDATAVGLFELMSSETPQKLTAIPLPELDAGPHVGYVGQWIIIGISAIGVYITVMRRLRQEYQARETKSA